jgi:Predicted membrane protein
MKKLAVLGRILFALPFGIMGLNHFLMTDVFIGMMSSFIPGGAFTVLLTGALLIAGCISIILNKNLKIACFGLAGFLFIFIVTIHIPGLFTSNWQIALVELLKDTGLMGGAIMIAVFSESLKSNNIKE